MKIRTILISALLLSAGMLYGMNPSYSALPKNAAQLYYYQACNDEQSGNYENAIEKMKKAIEIKNDNALYYTKLAGLYSATGEWSKALATYKKAAKLRPDDSFLYVSIGNILQQLNDYQSAYEAYSHVLELAPDYKYNYYNIANVQINLKKYKEAIDYTFDDAFLETADSVAAGNPLIEETAAGTVGIYRLSAIFII